MKRIITVLITLFTIVSCSKKQGNMIVKGKIKGLKKGNIYLQKIVDTTLIAVDSVTLFGKDNFILSDDVSSPVMYYLTLKGKKEDKKLMFFGEQGEITITDNVENFGLKPKISGSENQKIIDKFNTINSKFKDQRLNFIAKDYQARANKDTAEILRLESDYKKMMRRRFLYTTNFAVNNRDFEAAPYIALSELFDANVYFLDTINNSLTKRIKESDYGKRLNTYIEDIKAKQKKQ